MALSPTFVAPMAGAWSPPSAPSRSRIGSRREPQRLYTAAAATSAACVTHLRRKVQRRASAEDGLALVLRSKLQELAKTSPAQRAAQRWQDLGEAKVLMPENSIPWGVTHFIGGAVLGQFPELCYSSLLQPFVDKTGMAVICTPYELGRDHMGLAELVSANFAEALQLAQQRFGWAVDRMPRLAMGHSLGAKLQVLLHCRDEQSLVAGVALLAFNNYGVEDQVRLVREFLKAVQGPGAGAMGGMGGLGADQLWSTFLEPAIGRAAKLSGVEFTPNPNDMLDLVEDKFNKDLRTRLFRFSQDSLDCSEELLASLVMRGVRGADRLEMKGGHLTPVVVSLEDVGTMGGMAQNLGDRLKGFSAKVGSEAELEDLVQALMDFVKTIR